MYYLHHAEAEHRRMRNAVVAAVGMHLVLIFVTSFHSTRSSGYQRQIEVTLATSPSDRAPSDARHLAQDNQEGSGNEALQEAVTAHSNDLPQRTAEPHKAAPRLADEQRSASGELLSTVAAASRTVKPRKQQEQSLAAGVSPNADLLDPLLASAQAELASETRMDVANPRVRRITSMAAQQSADAAYLLDWRQRLEAVGNKFYPEASIRYGLYGDLRLLVVISKTGSLEGVRVLQSSGYAVLDEAAVKIVHMAAPYAPFPPELAATTDRLEIVRTWQFRENELGSH